MRGISPLLRPHPLLAAALLTLAACHPDKKEDPKPQPVGGKSVYVINEGTTNGAISLYNKETRGVTRDLFAPANGGRQLGPVVQSMTAVGERLYLVVNGSNRIEVVNRTDFRAVAVIDSTSSQLKLSQPRYMVASSTGKAYVTEWLGGYPNYARGRVSVLDLNTNRITKQIAVGVNPEQLLLVNNRLYVTNSYGTQLTIIDPTRDLVVDSVAVPEGPKNLALDNAGNLWVLCSRFGGTQDYLVRFQPGSPTTQTRIAFANSYENGNLRTNAAGDRIYVSLSEGVYQLTPTATSLPAAPLIRRNFYGLGLDPQDGTIYAGLARFSGDDQVIRYTPAGAPIDSFRVAVGPNGFMFY